MSVRLVTLLALAASACAADDSVAVPPSLATHFLQAEAYALQVGKTAADLGVSVQWQDGTTPSSTLTPGVRVGIRQDFSSAEAARAFATPAVYSWNGKALAAVAISPAMCDFVRELGFSAEDYRGVIVGREVQFTFSGKSTTPLDATLIEPQHIAWAMPLTCRQSLPSTLERLPDGYELVYTLSSPSKNVTFELDGELIAPAAIARGALRYLYEIRIAYPKATTRDSIRSELRVTIDGKPLASAIEVGFRECGAKGVVEEHFLSIDNNEARVGSWTCLQSDGLSTAGTNG